MKIVSQSHVTDAEIERIVSGRIESAALRRLLAHLARCLSCRGRARPRLAALGAALHGTEAAGPDEEGRPVEAADDQEIDRAIDRAMGEALRREPLWREEREWRERLIAAQKDLPPYRLDGRHALFPGGEDLEAPDWAFVEALMALSHHVRYRDPQSMYAFAYGAASAAQALGARAENRGRYTPVQVADLQVRALGELANACRLNDKFDQAEETIAIAREHLAEVGSGDLMIATRLLDILASLRMDQRQLGEALDLLDEVSERYLEMGETHLAGRALISKGIATFYDGRPREAVSLLKKGVGLIDAERDPNLSRSGYYNLLNALVESGDCGEAKSVLLRSGLRQAFAEDPLNLLKLRWLEGKIFAGNQKLQQAEAVLAEVKAGFGSHGRAYEAAIVGLELAAVHLRQRNAAAAEEQAVEALETFRDLKVSHEARKAVLYFREACRQRIASAVMAQKIARFLQQLERDPTLRFAAV